MSQYFLKLYRNFGGNINVKVDLSNYATKADAGIDTSNFALNNTVNKVNNTDISGFVLKTKHDTDKSELEKKIPETSGLVKKNRLYC